MPPTSMPSSWCAAAKTLGHRPGRPAAAEPDLAGQGRGRLHDRPVRGRLGRSERVRCPQGRLSSAWSRRVDRAGAPYVSVWFRQADCGACPARPLCTRGKHQARRPEAAVAGRARGAQGGARAAHDQGGPAPLRATGRDRGDHLAGRARVRAAPQPLPRPRQDPPPARGDRGRDQSRAPRRLVPGGPARRHPHLALRRPRRRLTRLRPTVSARPLEAAEKDADAADPRTLARSSLSAVTARS